MSTHPTHHGIPFRTSTYSTSDCVAVATTPATVAVADTKTRHAAAIEVPATAWTTFLEHMKG
jgi:hypothetical protein